MDKYLIELFHESGNMPDKFYNQLNGKSAQENYNDWHNQQFSEEISDDVHITSEVNIHK